MNANTIVDTLPTGYRWATETETENWTMHVETMVQVRTGPDDETDLAIFDPYHALVREVLVQNAYYQISLEKGLTMLPVGPNRAAVPPHWRDEAEARAASVIEAVFSVLP